MHPLRALARWHGLQPSYCDALGRRQSSSAEALMATLRGLGVAIESPPQAAELLGQRRLECWQTMLPAVVVVWDGAPLAVDLRLADRLSAHIEYRLEIETGEAHEGTVDVSGLTLRARRCVGGESYGVWRLRLPMPTPLGYHRLTVRSGPVESVAFVISAPLRAYADPNAQTPGWGAFLPLYALYRARSWGGGDFSDLAALVDWVDRKGGKLVATLPLVASFVEQTGDPSPYAPASRLFGNELYLDPTRCPEFHHSAQARRRYEELEQSADVAALRAAEFVDYGGWVGTKRRLLSLLAEEFFNAGDERRDQLARFLVERPDAEEYARFRAAAERHGVNWRSWPEPLRSGTLPPGTYDEAAFRYHLYGQWQLHEQLLALIEEASSRQMAWYVDLPLGVRADGYDAWHEPDLFVHRASGGAPPDVFFTKGQDWGFPPLHPQRLRRQQFRYFIRTLRAQMRYARLLRLDHVMGLHRLYWVPQGLAATNGAYVQYPAEELLAILALESQRHGCGIVGENLGTVSPAVNRALYRHGVRRMFVVQYEVKPAAEPVFRDPEADEIASLNTHDMPPFRSFWEGLDIADRLDLGLLNAEQAAQEESGRAEFRRKLVRLLCARGFLAAETSDVALVLRGLLSYLGASSAPMVVVNLEDLWLETVPQNTPGTLYERQNWRHRARLSLEQLQADRQVADLLAALAAARRLSAGRADPPVP